MTAEVAVLNRIGIALAADSAVTIGRKAEKIYASADKLFQLHASAPVGIMIFGSASIVGVPWETVIKTFRKQIGSERYPALDDYVKSFNSFLNTPSNLFPEATQDRHAIDGLSANLFLDLRDQLKKAIGKAIEDEAEVTDDDVARVCKKVFEDRLALIKKQPELDGFGEVDRRSIRKKYSKQLRKLRAEVFGTLPMSRRVVGVLNEIVSQMLTCHYFGPMRGGIVISGFGEDEYMPRLVAFDIEEFACGRVRMVKTREMAISSDNSGAVVPFAQQEMVQAFMEGVDKSFMNHIISSTKEIFHGAMSAIVNTVKEVGPDVHEKLEKEVMPAQRKALKSLFDNWAQCTQGFWQPVVEIVSSLPKDELAAMAESLVNLTKFRRRVTRVRETVGGPIDVAVITKGDGFVWVNRKHYFPAELNPRAMAKYQNGG